MAELIVALDLPTAEAALLLVEEIPELRWVKVGSVLLNRTNAGPALIQELVARGLEVFLDQKWHDIPNTVLGAAEGARALGVRLATVHTLGGPAMMAAAADGAGTDGQLAVVGVTILTSHTPADYGRTIGRAVHDLRDEVRRLANDARAAGLPGVVCSPDEVDLVREAYAGVPDPWIVVPGIRRASDAAGDQVRFAPPREVVERGGTHLVVGRPVLRAEDPRGAYLDILEEMA